MASATEAMVVPQRMAMMPGAKASTRSTGSTSPSPSLPAEPSVDSPSRISRSRSDRPSRPSAPTVSEASRRVGDCGVGSRHVVAGRAIGREVIHYLPLSVVVMGELRPGAVGG